VSSSNYEGFIMLALASTQAESILANIRKTNHHDSTQNFIAWSNFLGAATEYVGCPENVRTLKIARQCVDLAGRGKCYFLVMSLTNCVAKTALLYLA
jgi:hypothetical protein